MELENYNDLIADMVSKSKRDMIANLPQPNMFGGRRPRQHPLPAMNFSPSTLSVGGSPYAGYYGGAMLHGPVYGAHPLHGGFGFKDILNVGKSAASAIAPVVAEVARDVGKDALKSYLTGKGMPRPRGRPRKHAQGGFGFKDILNVGKSAASALAPIAGEIARDVGKDALKSYLTGKGMPRPRGRPRKHHTPIHPYGGMAIPEMYGAHLAGGAMMMPIEHYAHLTGNNGIVSDPLRDIRLRKGGKVPNWLKSIGNALNPATSPIAKEVYKDVGTAAALAAMGLGHPPKRGRKARALAQHYAAAHGGKVPNWLKSIGNTLAPVGNFVAKEIVAPIAKDVGKDLLKSALTGKGGARAARGAIVKQVMKQHGLSLPAASKFVKEHGLY